MRKYLWIATMTVGLGGFSAVASAQCVQDSDCAEGDICLATPCAEPDCPPDSEECPAFECESVCVEDEGASEQCSEDADCGDGMLCEVVGASSCAGMPPCPDGETCADPEPCEAEEFFACVPAPCVSDVDCAGDLACVTFGWDSCTSTDVICPPDTECEVPDEEPTCESFEQSACVPAYVAPCSVDADCGGGFTCTQSEDCMCSGSDGEEPTCSCEPSGDMYCEPVQIDCDADSDCPADWMCEQWATAAPCEFNSDTGETFCPEGDEGSQCVPPHWEDWGGYTSNGGYASAGERATGNEDAAAQAPTAPTDDSAGNRTDDGGCTVASSGSKSAGGWLALLGVVVGGGLRRRRR